MGCCCPRSVSSHRTGSDVESGFEEGESMPDPNGGSPLKRQSARLTEGDDRAGARAMLRAIGFTREDLAKPLIGVGHSWIETMPCNYNHRRLTEKVKAGVRAAGGTPMEFNTIAVSDGVSMGTEGMKASLVSREVIADSIELVARGHLFDGLVMIVGCDKTIPAAVMRSEEHTSELQSRLHLVCRLLLEKKKNDYHQACFARSGWIPPVDARAAKFSLPRHRCFRSWVSIANASSAKMVYSGTASHVHTRR